MGWDGQERRSGGGFVGGHEFGDFVRESESQRKEMREMVRGIQGVLVEVQRDMKCIHTTWDRHVEEYGQLLKDTKADKETRAKLRAAIIEKSAVAAAWIMLAFVATAVWNSFKEHIR